MKKIWDTIRWFTNKAGDAALDARAGQSAFFMVISFFPALLLVVSLCRAMHIAESELLGDLVRLLPSAAAELILSVIQEATARSESAFVSVSAAAALWAISRSVHAAAQGLRAVYGVEETRHFILVRLVAVVYTGLLLLLIGLALVLLVFWKSIVVYFVPVFPDFQPTAVFILSFRSLAAAVVFTLFFTLMYKVLPNNPLPFFRLFPGGLFSALGWLLFSRLFSFYIENFSNYASLYGSLTAVVLLMLWLYFCMYILFLGGAVNVWLQQRRPQG